MMIISFSPQTTDVDHIIQPYLATMLDRFTYVIVSPYMGLAQFERFGERIVVDCRVPPELDAKRAGDGKPVSKVYEELALSMGLSVLTR